jgi:hypothetical protein
MIPKVLCRECSAELIAADKYCSSCGAQVEWEKLNAPIAISQSSSTQTTMANTVRCSLCGHHHTAVSIYCESCGNLLQQGTSQQTAEVAKPSKTPKAPQSSMLQSLQSWKLTLGLAVVFIAVIFIFQSSKNNDPAPITTFQPPVNSQVLSEIQSLENTVATNPNDKSTLLRLANLLHDVNFHGKAIERYQQYLRLDPNNVEARVDLGVTYFNFALSDSMHYLQFLNKARQEMETAIGIAPQHQLGLFNLGIVNLHLGDMSKATEWFQKCAAVDSTTETGKKALRLVNQHSFTNPS